MEPWTYRELTGLHGLHLLSLDTQDTQLAERTRSIALHHQHHTQPDYTTYQPWALAAFCGQPDTVLFAEQQLHDVETHLHVEGPSRAVVVALLLADATLTLEQFAGQGV